MKLFFPCHQSLKFLEFETNKDQFVPILTSQPPRRCLHCSQISSRLSEIALFPNWPLFFFKHLQLERNSRRGLSQSSFLNERDTRKRNLRDVWLGMGITIEHETLDFELTLTITVRCKKNKTFR